VLAGTLDIDASVKAALRALLRCVTSRSVTFERFPGFLPGTVQEYGGIIRHGREAAVQRSPKRRCPSTVITRKAYGGALLRDVDKHIPHR